MNNFAVSLSENPSAHPRAAVATARVLVGGDPALAMSPGAGLLVLAVYVCAVLLLSQMTFRWIEDPFREKAKQFAAQRFGRGLARRPIRAGFLGAD